MLNVNIFSSLKVLYVDDEPENLQAFSYALIDECDVATFQSPAAALEAVETDAGIAVIVADIRMPEMDGFEFLHRAGKVNPFTANLILTGHTDEALAIKALNGQLCIGYHKKADAFAGQNLVSIIRDAGLRYADRHGREILTANATQIVKRMLRVKDRTFAHTSSGVMAHDNVELLCRYLLPFLDVPLVDKEILLLAAVFHDVGKIAVRDEILAAPHVFSVDQHREMKGHVAHSDEILRGLRGLEKCHQAAVDHHEHFDGSGYPRGKKGLEISLFGRILAVVDFFDALASERSYKPGMPLAQVMALIESEAGTKFDPGVVKAFSQMWRDNPQLEEHYRLQNALVVAQATPAPESAPETSPPIGSIDVPVDHVASVCAALRQLADAYGRGGGDAAAVKALWSEHDLAFLAARLEDRLRTSEKPDAARRPELALQ
ncbi:MAG: HD domain-containing phosphohydrolase [Myxococcota bacterium]